MAENFANLHSIVQAGLDELNVKQKPEGLYDPIQYILQAGGKRIRPIFTLMSCQLWNGSIDKAKYAALGFEYFHNFTLLHDDVMDCADMRRGRATVHKKWNQNTAILSGDAMFTLACMLVGRTEGGNLKAVMDSFYNVSIGVCQGQQYDMEFETRDNVSMQEYMEMIRLKTSVLLAGALECGALIAGAGKDGVESMYRIGESLGIAFQLQDDWLDLYGDESKFGKKIGSDIRECKKTYLYLKAIELLGDGEATKLKKLFSLSTDKNENLENRIADVSMLYEQINMKQVCVEEIKRWYEQAKEDISKLVSIGANKDGVEVFSNFVKDLMGRDF